MSAKIGVSDGGDCDHGVNVIGGVCVCVCACAHVCLFICNSVLKIRGNFLIFLVPLEKRGPN